MPPPIAPTPLPKSDVVGLGGAYSSLGFYSGIFSPAKVPPEIGLNIGTFAAPSLGYPKGLVVIVVLACY